MSKVESKKNLQQWENNTITISEFIFLFMNNENHNTAELRIRRVLLT